MFQMNGRDILKVGSSRFIIVLEYAIALRSGKLVDDTHCIIINTKGR